MAARQRLSRGKSRKRAPARSTAARPPALPAWLGPLAILAAGLVMLRWSWRRWPDPLIDFGQQLYIAWRLAEGDALYRDVSYFHGPLAPSLNGLWMKLFGPGMMVLAVVNLALLAAIATIVYGLLARLAGRWAAAVGGLLFITLFALLQAVPIGNYNYLTPYEHGITYGLLAALGCLWGWQRFFAAPMARDRRRALALAGLCLGLTLLTKVEIALAAAGASALALALATPGAGGRRSGRGATLAIFAVAAAQPPAAALLLLAVELGGGDALAALLAPWQAALGSPASTLAFYRQGLGADDVAGNLSSLLFRLGGWVAVLGPALAVAWLPRRDGRPRHVLALTLFAIVAGVAIFGPGRDIAWHETARPLPLAIAAALLVALWHWRRRRDDINGDEGEESDGRARAAAVAVVCAFALLLLLKMALNTRLYHYGFVLAMPATLAIAAALVAVVPRALTRRGRSGELFAAVAAAALLAVVAGHLRLHAARMASRTVPVAEGRDRIVADARGGAVARALEMIERHVGRDETLAVLPEGIMLNYLARRRNPTPYMNFVPTELAIFGEETILEAFGRAPPDWVMLVHRDTSEFGYRFFGRDYARALDAWIRRGYRPVARLGAPPLRDDRFGILLLKRRG